MDVFLLWHVHEMPDGEEDAKLIGVYASAQDAELAEQRVLPLPGFRAVPAGFQISRYTLGQDHWTEGYVTDTHDQLLRQFEERASPADSSGALTGAWAVWRIDDNANTFLVRGGLSWAEAEQVAAEFTGRGHKQMYWVECETAEPAPTPEPAGGQ